MILGGYSLFYLCRLQLSLSIKPNQTYKWMKAKKIVCITSKLLLFIYILLWLILKLVNLSILGNTVANSDFETCYWSDIFHFFFSLWLKPKWNCLSKPFLKYIYPILSLQDTRMLQQLLNTKGYTKLTYLIVKC